jgi:hypothetical protein
MGEKPGDATPAVIDARFRWQRHECRGMWHYAGLNGGGHEIYRCDRGHVFIASHVAEDHLCAPCCAVAPTAPAGA